MTQLHKDSKDTAVKREGKLLFVVVTAIGFSSHVLQCEADDPNATLKLVACLLCPEDQNGGVGGHYYSQLGCSLQS